MYFRQALRRSDGGFTLVEVLLAVSLVGMMAALVFGSLFVTTSAIDERLQQTGIRRQAKEDVRTEQIDDDGTAAELLPDEEALTGSARSKQEEGLLPKQLPNVQDAVEFHEHS